MPASEDPRAKFGLTCPVDGQFFICQNSSTKFIGCCKVDPCTSELDGVCPDSELFVASYSAASGMMFLQQDCADPFNGSIWYTCDNARPPFLGCCMNDPCNNGCLDGNLVAATLSNDLKNASQLMLSDTTSTTTDTISSSTSSSTTGTGILPKGTENSSSGSMSSDGARAGMIAGISVAGVVILLLVVAAYLWVKRRERARQKSAYEPGLANGTSENVIPSHGSCQATSPVEKSVIFAPNSTRSSRDPRAAMPSPSTSENFQSPHFSFISELEGSSGLHTALRPHTGHTYRDFEGRG